MARRTGCGRLLSYTSKDLSVELFCCRRAWHHDHMQTAQLVGHLHAVKSDISRASFRQRAVSAGQENLMGDQEVCVCYFFEILGCPQPKIWRHLANLRSAGVVAARLDGKWMHYRIAMPPHLGASQILKQTLNWLKQEKAIQKDRAQLTKACCSLSKYTLLDGAPLPAPVQELCCEAC